MDEPYVATVSVLHMDEYYNIDHWPTEGDKAVAEPYKSTPGGSVSNMSVILSTLGTKVAFYDILSTSKTADSLLHDLEKNGIDVSCVRRAKGMKDSKCLIFRSDKERTIVWMRHEKKTVEPDEATLKMFSGAAWIYGSLGIKMLDNLWPHFQEYRKHGVKVAMDVEGDYGPHGREIIDGSDVLFFNQFGWKSNRGTNTEEEYIRHLLRCGVSAIVMTKGKNGCRVVTGEKDFLSKAIHVPVVDTNGAGDSFNASFLHSLMQGHTYEEAADFANRMASLCVTGFGPRSLVETLKEMK